MLAVVVVVAKGRILYKRENSYRVQKWPCKNLIGFLLRLRHAPFKTHVVCVALVPVVSINHAAKIRNAGNKYSEV